MFLNFKTSRSPSSARFLYLLRSLAIALLCGGLVLLFELTLYGLFPIWQQALSRPFLWIYPCLMAVILFFLQISRGKMLLIVTILSIGCCGLILAGMLSGYQSTDLVQLLYLRERTIQKDEQQTQPVYDHTVRMDESAVPVYFETDQQGTPLASDDEQKIIAKMIDSIPSFLLKNVSGIYFLGEDTFFSLEQGASSSSTLGFAALKTGTITIRLHPAAGIPTDSDISPAILFSGSYYETLIHELFHLQDFKAEGRTLLYSDSPQWKEFYDQYGHSLSLYGSTSPTEFFAEAGTWYLLDPNLLNSRAPEIFEWFEQNMPLNRN